MKRELCALWLAYSDPRTPWLARLLIVCIMGRSRLRCDCVATNRRVGVAIDSSRSLMVGYDYFEELDDKRNLGSR